jgi:hypothetical protein
LGCATLSFSMTDYDVWLINVESRMNNEKWGRENAEGYLRGIMRDAIAQFSCKEPCKLQIILSPGRGWKHRPLEYKAESNCVVRSTKFWVALLYRGFLSVQQPKSDLERLIVKVSTSHKTRHTHTHTRGRTPLSEGSARRRGRYPHNTQHTNYTYMMPSAGLEHAIPAMKRLQTYAWGSTDVRLYVILALTPPYPYFRQRRNRLWWWWLWR